jgi:hypothetical protein
LYQSTKTQIQNPTKSTNVVQQALRSPSAVQFAAVIETLHCFVVIFKKKESQIENSKLISCTIQSILNKNVICTRKSYEWEIYDVKHHALSKTT